MLQINKKRAAKGLSMGLALVLALGVFAGCGKKDSSATSPNSSTAAHKKNVVATYKGGEVTQTEFDKFIGVSKMLDSTGQLASMLENETYKSMFLENYLQQEAALEILATKMSDEGKKKAQEQVDAFKKQVKDMATADKKSYEDSLKTNKIKQKDMEDYIYNTVGVMTDMKNKVTDDQVKAEYDKNNAEKLYNVVDVRHILIATKDLSDSTGKTEKRTDAEALKIAKEVIDKLKGGAKFEDLAKEYSEDTGSKDNGGLYSAVPEVNSGMVEPFEKAMNSLKIGEISEPVKSDYGYHVMKVDARKTYTLDEKKDEIKSSLSQTNFQNFMEKDFPSYSYVSFLPKPSASPSTSPAPTSAASAAPSASVAPSASTAPTTAATQK
ncbi:peptidylprolyl isomerase [Gorillibacterium massiliense]|uniref:peptidylprolyl isomerase n=1 Tax=Gorillibacterium massiliense TaxID=1280390 RepID=UPI0004B167AD|nr:peptidylprolyl isomerase [Gorillibacterium massiliense]